MSRLVFAKEFMDDYVGLQPAVRQKVQELPGKFEQGSAHAGTHLERLVGAADPRVRTVRVDQYWRGVVLHLDTDLYVLVRVLGEEQANKWATRHKFGVNPVTGIFEVIHTAAVEEVSTAVTASTQAMPMPTSLFGHRTDKDFRQLGVDSDIVPALRRLGNDDELLAIAVLLPDAQSAAVLGLAGDKPVDALWSEILDDYDLDKTPVDTSDVAAAFDRPGTRAGFLVTDTDQEVAAALTGDFQAWRTFLHPSQRKIAYRDTYNGPVRVTGGAGTGKTVVAIHRARHLAQLIATGDDKEARILVATYTNALLNGLTATLRDFCTPEEHQRLHITTVDAHALQTARISHPKLRPISGDMLRQKADEAAELAGLTADHALDGRFLLAEWEQVILSRDHKTATEYLTSPRPGRGRPLSRPARKSLWAALERLTANLAATDHATHLQIAHVAADVLDARTVRPFAHVVVDEAQDLHPAHWKFLRACVRQAGESRPNDLFITGDAHQRIYDYRVSLSALGIETRGRSKRLKVNYRTSQQILSWSLAILTGAKFDDLDGEVDTQEGYRSSFSGPAPICRHFTTPAEESRWVATQIRGWLNENPIESVGVLARTRDLLESTAAALSESNVRWRHAKDDNPAEAGTAPVVLSTMHSAKGLEFPRLVVVAVNSDAIPLPVAVTPEAVDPVQHEQDLLRERCLLYVACTRARDQLLVTSSGTPSELLPT